MKQGSRRSRQKQSIRDVSIYLESQGKGSTMPMTTKFAYSDMPPHSASLPSSALGPGTDPQQMMVIRAAGISQRILGSRRGSAITWVVVKIRVSFWVLIIIRHLILRYPKKGP